MRSRAIAVAGAATAVLLLTGFGPPDPNGFSDAELATSVSPLTLNVDAFATNVTDAAERTRDGSDELVTLSSDVLFAFGKATLSEPAQAKIRSLVDDVPKNSRLSVTGHTDSVGSTSSNRKLSVARAKAAAAVIRAQRPDLTLTVAGYGESRPVAPNTSGGKDNPEGRAKNRRVELRYRG
ncbi:OmpA family protein [Micropruina sp.]|uniref:OmpA family protein n=1 Tax=Micropruina sp. TaxID=2737536 RepID=UPI0039E21D3D